MPMWRPDPTFYPSPRMAMKAPAETLAYVASFDPQRLVPDVISVIDLDRRSPTYSQLVGTVA
ncbi:MAG: methanethiol oxidase, partial [Acetobacteraceae bacterium]|nr:methanethiol oxidase [Acetobacteraceae bacterium]